MSAKKLWLGMVVLIWVWLELSGAAAAEDVPAGSPMASVDLRTAPGAGSVAAVWRFSEARIREVDFHSAGPD
ncbi:MAG: hypothetical protein ACREJT_07560, partial [Myxococcota bacterium]